MVTICYLYDISTRILFLDDEFCLDISSDRFNNGRNKSREKQNIVLVAYRQKQIGLIKIAKITYPINYGTPKRISESISKY